MTLEPLEDRLVLSNIFWSYTFPGQDPVPEVNDAPISGPVNASSLTLSDDQSGLSGELILPTQNESPAVLQLGMDVYTVRQTGKVFTAEEGPGLASYFVTVRMIPSVATETTVTSSVAPSVYGQEVVFTASVASDDEGSPTGTVQFLVDGSNFGAPVPLVDGSADSPATTSLAAGVHSVSASFRSDGPFLPSTGDLEGGQEVTPAPLTIRADDLSKVYGAPLPTMTASYGGFVNGETSDSLTTLPTLTTTATAASHVGGSPYPIIAGGAADPNYAITYAAGDLTVTPALLTIRADDQIKPFGADLPSLTASYSGFVNGDTSDSLAVPPTLTTTATPLSPASGGPYAILVSGAADSDYDIHYVQGALTVFDLASLPPAIPIAEGVPVAPPPVAPAPPVAKKPTDPVTSPDNGGLAVKVFAAPGTVGALPGVAEQAAASPSLIKANDLVLSRPLGPGGPAERGGSSFAAPAAAPGTRNAKPAWEVTGAQSEFGFSLDLPAPSPLTLALGPGGPTESASAVGLASGSGRTDADLYALWVDPPAKAFQAASAGFEGDDSVTLFETVARARPASPQTPPAAPPVSADESPGPRVEAARPPGRGWTGWLAAWLASPLFACVAGGLQLQRRPLTTRP